MKAIDVHAHILGEERMALLRKEIPKLALKLAALDAEMAMFDVAGTAYRPFPRGGWDIERRFDDMASPRSTCRCSRRRRRPTSTTRRPRSPACVALQNDEIARLVKAYPDASWGSRRCRCRRRSCGRRAYARGETLGMRGTKIGSNVNGTNLDDPSFEPFWAAAESSAPS